jgi:Fe-S-cluster containining protein
VGDDGWQRYLNFRCTGCGNCCRGTHVLITDEDVRRVEQGTGKAAIDFVRFVPEDDVALEKRSPWWIRLGSKRAALALKHRPGGACTFLDDENRCSIYEHRPVTCREHPFEPEVSDSGKLEFIGLSDIVDCPHDWDGRIKRRDVVKTSRWNERQSDAYLDEVQHWNRRRSGRKTRPGFLRFLGFDA